MRKLKYYLTNTLYNLIPQPVLHFYVKQQLASLPKHTQNRLQKRVDYYMKLQSSFPVSQQAPQIAQFKKNCGSTYFFDLLKVIKGFDRHLRFNFIHGDVTDIPAVPTFVKSRPISDHNGNSVLLKLNAIRHYRFVEDTLEFRHKKNMAVWRGSGFRPNRRNLLEKYYYHERCDLGRTDKEDEDQLAYVVPKMSIEDQLKFKFILSLEGKDVATNLKWIMSSNSLAMSPKLRYETWFMEGKLIANVHYVEIKDDFSDLIEKMDYYNAHPEEAERIINNAHQWVEQFKNPHEERLLSYLVADKYFYLSQNVRLAENNDRHLLASIAKYVHK
ncbi:glycosyl transferase family 90 [Vibrio zhugei]|uniref:Glycosyl transferase family 90 n=1 Tax=Vibrio zhugei TaxID=2479546 RepID=A0ABV7C674_9VIBR|nr:glycosyl transferase family 90 [Vibrio zhugei]